MRKPGSVDGSTDYAALGAGDLLTLELTPHTRVRWTRVGRNGSEATRYVSIGMVDFYEELDE